MAKGKERASRVIRRSDDQDRAEVVGLCIVAQGGCFVPCARDWRGYYFNVLCWDTQAIELADGDLVKIQIALLGTRPASLPVIAGEEYLWRALLGIQTRGMLHALRQSC